MSKDEQELDPNCETELVNQCKNCDQEAWRLLVYLRGPSVEKWLKRYRLQESDQDDVFQEVWKTVAATIGQFQDDNFSGWLFTITHSRVCDHFRRQRKDGVHETNTHLVETFAVNDKPKLVDESGWRRTFADGDHGYETLRAAMVIIRRRVKPETWNIFWETEVRGRPSFEVAKELNKTSSAVRMTKSRVLKMFKELMIPDDVAP